MKTYKLLINGVSYEAVVLEYSSNQAKISVNGREHVITIEDDKQINIPKSEVIARPAPSAPSLVSGTGMSDDKVQAPLPGVIVRIPVREGDTVKQGQPIIIIEAMKMESEINAPMNGKIGKIMVQERSLVQEGDVLMTFEADKVEAPQQPAAPKRVAPAPAAPATPPPAPAAPKPAAPAGANFLRAPIPGTIIDVKVSEGQEVSEGDVAVILEAMKMESDIHVFQGGRVKKIHVRKGDSVQEGDPLIELEA
ncbi:MAG TPA: biotin/lipoyl-binding protein [Candidatus Cloacimonetes bacterium]|nr:biotin/lipoyl-binding protein [Candidatus Cloacimonadota bacterium]